MNEDLLKAAVDKFKENFVQVIAESKGGGYLTAGILNLKTNQLTIFDSTEFNTYTETFTKSEVEECFIIHDYNNWSV